MRCERYKKSAGKVNKVLYIPHVHGSLLHHIVKLMKGSSMCSGSFWQVWYVLVGSCVPQPVAGQDHVACGPGGYMVAVQSTCALRPDTRVSELHQVRGVCDHCEKCEKTKGILLLK